MSALLSISFSGTGSNDVGQLFAQNPPQRPGATDLPSIPARTTSPAVRQVTPADQVQVSKQSEALLLYSQGQTLTAIEATLGLPETLLTSYLGITNGTQTLEAAAAAAVAAQQPVTASGATA